MCIGLRSHMTIWMSKPVKWRWVGLCRRTRVELRYWLSRFEGENAVFATEGCTGWRFVVEELERAGVTQDAYEYVSTVSFEELNRVAVSPPELFQMAWPLPSKYRSAVESPGPVYTLSVPPRGIEYEDGMMITWSFRSTSRPFFIPTTPAPATMAASARTRWTWPRDTIELPEARPAAYPQTRPPISAVMCALFGR